jgi:hypothetical protein
LNPTTNKRQPPACIFKEKPCPVCAKPVIELDPEKHGELTYAERWPNHYGRGTLYNPGDGRKAWLVKHADGAFPTFDYHTCYPPQVTREHLEIVAEALTTDIEENAA